MKTSREIFKQAWRHCQRADFIVGSTAAETGLQLHSQSPCLPATYPEVRLSRQSALRPCWCPVEQPILNYVASLLKITEDAQNADPTRPQAKPAPRRTLSGTLRMPTRRERSWAAFLASDFLIRRNRERTHTDAAATATYRPRGCVCMRSRFRSNPR